MKEIWGSLSRKRLGLIMLALCLSLLAGCASMGGAVKTWKGDDIAEDQAAMLHAPEDIEVLSVNGRKMASYLLDNIAVDYQLKPGPTVVTFRYRAVWATGKASADKDGTSVQKVQSDRLQVRFEAAAGADYEFAFSRPGNRKDAQVMAENFSARLVNEDNTVVARSTAYQAPQPVAEESTSQTAVSASASSGAVAPSPVPQNAQGEPLPTLEALQLLWNRASKEDKKTFLRWAFQ
ncbi:DUF2057 family protein [Marinobacteraceae bacterium S3BR75-40.1]